MMTPRTAGNPNALNVDFPMVRKAVAYIRRTRTVFGFQILYEFAVTNRTMFNAAALYKNLENLVIRAKKGDRRGTGTEYKELALKVGVVLTTDLVFPAPASIGLDDQGSEIDITWPAVQGATNYVVQRSTAANFAGAIQIYSGANLTYTNTGVAAATTYYYRVKAQKSGFTDSAWTSGSITTAGE